MKKLLLLVALGVVGAANAQTIYESNNATVARSYQIGVADPGRIAHPPAIAYSNVTTFTGSAYSYGGATGGLSKVAADDLHFNGAFFGGNEIKGIKWSTVNFNTTAVAVRMRLRFWADNGAGSPGTLLGGVDFGAISIAASTVNVWTSDFTGFGILLPSSGIIHAGVGFDNVGATATTDAQLSNFGQGIFDPPTVGSSLNQFWQSTAVGSNFVNNPAGGLLWFGGTPKANFGWELKAVPEPATMAVLGLGAAALLRRRRKA